MRLARKSLSFAAVALMSVGLMSPVAQAQAERVVAPEERDAYVQEFFQDGDVTPVVDGSGGLTDAEVDAFHQAVREAQQAGPLNDEIIAGEMLSDKIILPSQVDKVTSDEAEVAVAKQQAQPQTFTTRAATCQYFPFSPHQVCGAILQRYNQLGSLLSFLLDPIGPQIQNPDGVGFHQQFRNGFIFWHPDTGAHAITARNAEVFARNGWSAGWMGYPLGGEVPVSGSNPIDGELNGWVQLFEGGRIYRTPVLEGFQVASINGLILDRWLELGGTNSILGLPIADEAITSDGIGRYSIFQHGMMYWHPQHGAHPVSGDILNKWSAAGYENGLYGYPISDPNSEDGIKNSQIFQGGNFHGYSSPIPEIAQIVGLTDSQIDTFYMDFSQLMQENDMDLRIGLSTALEHAQYSAEATKKEIERLRVEALSMPSEVSHIGTFAINSGMRNDCSPNQLKVPGNASTNPGDFFYSGATTSGRGVSVNHGHNGIFVERRGTTPDTIITVQALNPTQGVQRVPGLGSLGVCNPRYFSVDTDNATRARAAQFALSQVGKGYNMNFPMSRSATANSPSFNCSSLVWAAYMSASGGSLDIGKNRWFSNAYRLGVYPIDLAESINTREFQ